MLDDRTDFERQRELNGLGYPPATGGDSSFALPAIIIAAILIVGGYFVVTYNGDTMRTASNSAPITQPAPAPKPLTPPASMPAVNPAPPATPPANPQ